MILVQSPEDPFPVRGAPSESYAAHPFPSLAAHKWLMFPSLEQPSLAVFKIMQTVIPQSPEAKQLSVFAMLNSIQGA